MSETTKVLPSNVAESSGAGAVPSVTTYVLPSKVAESSGCFVAARRTIVSASAPSARRASRASSSASSAARQPATTPPNRDAKPIPSNQRGAKRSCAQDAARIAAGGGPHVDDEPAVDVTDDFPHETALERGDELVPNPLCNVLRAADLRYFKGLEPAGEEEEEEAEGFTRVVANLNYAGDSSNEALESSVRQVLLVPDALAEKMGDAEMDPPLTFGGERPELQWLHHFGVLVRKEEE